MKYSLLILMILMTFSSAFAQNYYWNCLTIDVDDESRLANAMDLFMATDKGKSMPIVSLSSIENMNSNLNATHQLCVVTENPGDLDNMDSYFANAEAMVLYEAWEDEVKVRSSILGRSLYANATGNSNVFSTVFSISVSDPAKFATAFKAFSASLPDVHLELHGAISGAENYVSHYVVARAKNLAEWIATDERVNSSEEFATFAQNAAGSFQVVNVTSMRELKSYNAPDASSN